MDRRLLLTYLNGLLMPASFQDYCPNGLQVAGASDIQKIVTGVTACQALLDKAVKWGADTVLVHHGYFWKAENPCIIGVKKHRLTTLLQNNLNLIAYHLPLDAHPIYGNNAKIAEKLYLEVEDNSTMLWRGKLEKPMKGTQFAHLLTKVFKRTPFYIPGKARTIKTIAWCSGGAQDYIDQADILGVDAFLTGEVSERTVHVAREAHIHFFAAGHHATERFGIQALGKHLVHKFQLTHKFIDIDNPI